ncbi:MAG: tetratricopeptide repeat protein [Gammaproteobacteria bacterium]|nr:tetratricopeptide repeat protein [Gammaproteobacteria bacterium]
MGRLSDALVSAGSLLVVAAVLGVLVVLARQPALQQFMPAQIHRGGAVNDELTVRFQQAAMMLHAGRYDHALAALHRVLELSPRLPEAHVNIGYALLGLGKLEAARGFFLSAIDLRPYQGNAYWGLAQVYEQQGDLPAALGAMRTYIHLAPPNDPYVRRARSALWEWEQQLQRGPLPEAEQRFLDQGARQWEDRNSPQLDSADPPPSGMTDAPLQP